MFFEKKKKRINYFREQGKLIYISSFAFMSVWIVLEILLYTDLYLFLCTERVPFITIKSVAAVVFVNCKGKL